MQTFFSWEGIDSLTQFLNNLDPKDVHVLFIVWNRDPSVVPSELFLNTWKHISCYSMNWTTEKQQFTKKQQLGVLLTVWEKEIIVNKTVHKARGQGQTWERNINKYSNRNFYFESAAKDSTSSCWRAFADKENSVPAENGRNEEPKHIILSMPKPLRYRTDNANAWTTSSGIAMIP